MMIRRPWLTVVGAACASFCGRPGEGARLRRRRSRARRAADAAECPKAAALAATVNDGLGRAALTPAGAGAAEGNPVRVVVRFERAAKGYAATVNVGGGRGGTRKLSDAGPGCATLGNAVGVLLDATARCGRRDAGRRGRGREAGPTTERRAAGSAAPAHATTAGVASAAASRKGWSGDGRRPRPRRDARVRRWSARVGGVWLPEKVNDYGPGRIEVGLAFARIALCGSTRVEQSSLTMALCAQQQVGWLRGHGFDYDAANLGADQLWLAAGASIVASGAFERSFGWEAEAGVVRLLRQQRFVIDNLGTGFQSDPWAFTMTLAFTTRLW